MGTNRPPLRFKQFNEPWEKKKLSSVCSIERGRFSPRPRNDPRYYGGNIPFVQTSDVTNSNGSVSKYSQTLNEEGLKVSKLFPSGTILITIAANIGHCGVLRQDMACPDSLIGMIVNSDNDAEFICTSLNRLQPRIDYLAPQAAQKNINVEFLKPLTLYLPSLIEQQKIAEFLSTVDKKISLLKEKHALLEQYKKGVMQKLFKQEIRFKDDGGSEFPDWQWKQGNEVFDAISNKSHNSDLPILAITQEHGAIPRDLINYQVQVTDGSVASYKVVEEGDYIISLRSFQGGIEYSRYKGICSPAYIILRPSISIDDDFYRYYLKTGRFIQEMKRRLEGIRDGKILSYKYFSEIKLPFPCIEEQRKISHFINSLDKKLSLVKEQVELTQTFKKGLLQQMFA